MSGLFVAAIFAVVICGDVIAMGPTVTSVVARARTVVGIVGALFKGVDAVADVEEHLFNFG